MMVLGCPDAPANEALRFRPFALSAMLVQSTTATSPLTTQASKNHRCIPTADMRLSDNRQA
jgi:hypothetical protein